MAEQATGGLVLVRRAGQGVVVSLPDGREFTITVVSGNAQSGVRLRFTGPEEVLVFRDEIAEAIQTGKDQP